MNTKENPLWLDNRIQFPRLIAEMAATCEFDTAELCDSMDITVEELNQLFERAHEEWENIKNGLT